MLNLFNALLSQHARSLKPMRYAEPMITQLQIFFEEVVVENSLQALVVESLPLRKTRTMREVEQIRRVGRVARFPFFLVSPEDEVTQLLQNEILPNSDLNNLILLPQANGNQPSESFVVIADPHFSALLCAVSDPTDGGETNHQVIYTFDPDVVYTALGYLQARVAVEHTEHTKLFHRAIHCSMPKATSLHLTLSVTSKLANLWQDQTVREIAVNRIGTAIRQSLELDQVLQTAVNEVGAALSTESCALLVESEENELLSVVYFGEEVPEDNCITIRSDLEAYKRRLRNNPQTFIRDGHNGSTPDGWKENPQTVVPISFLGHFVRVLFVQADHAERVWQEGEVRLLQTVADQVAIAIQHIRLYVKSQQETLRDPITGIFNRRFFEIQFEREYKLASRKGSTFALVKISVDNFKIITGAYGPNAANQMLKQIAHLLRSSLRVFDTLARYEGEEFIVILPQLVEQDAIACAERLRGLIEKATVPEIPQVTASFGIALFPQAGKTMPTMLEAADQALQRAKGEGQNRVCVVLEGERGNRDLEFFGRPSIIAAV